MQKSAEHSTVLFVSLLFILAGARRSLASNRAVGREYWVEERQALFRLTISLVTGNFFGTLNCPWRFSVETRQ